MEELGVQLVKLRLREVVPCFTVKMDVEVPAPRAKEGYEPLYDSGHTLVFQFVRQKSSQSAEDCIGEDLLPVQDIHAQQRLDVSLDDVKLDQDIFDTGGVARGKEIRPRDRKDSSPKRNRCDERQMLRRCIPASARSRINSCFSATDMGHLYRRRTREAVLKSIQVEGRPRKVLRSQCQRPEV